MKPIHSSLMISIVLAIFFSGCGMHLTRSYQISEIHREEQATLTFSTDTLGKSYGYLGLIRRLRLAVYEMQPGDRPGKLKPKEYLGTIWITKEENSKTIPIRSGVSLGLQIEYYEIFLNMHTNCRPSSILTAKRGGSYTLQYTQDKNKCWVRLTEAGTNESLVTGNDMTNSEEQHKGNKKSSEGARDVVPETEKKQ